MNNQICCDANYFKGSTTARVCIMCQGVKQPNQHCDVCSISLCNECYDANDPFFVGSLYRMCLERDMIDDFPELHTPESYEDSLTMEEYVDQISGDGNFEQTKRHISRLVQKKHAGFDPSKMTIRELIAFYHTDAAAASAIEAPKTQKETIESELEPPMKPTGMVVNPSRGRKRRNRDEEVGSAADVTGSPVMISADGDELEEEANGEDEENDEDGKDEGDEPGEGDGEENDEDGKGEGDEPDQEAEEEGDEDGNGEGDKPDEEAEEEGDKPDEEAEEEGDEPDQEAEEEGDEDGKGEGDEPEEEGDDEAYVDGEEGGEQTGDTQMVDEEGDGETYVDGEEGGEQTGDTHMENGEPTDESKLETSQGDWRKARTWGEPDLTRKLDEVRPVHFRGPPLRVDETMRANFGNRKISGDGAFGCEVSPEVRPGITGGVLVTMFGTGTTPRKPRNDGPPREPGFGQRSQIGRLNPSQKPPYPRTQSDCPEIPLPEKTVGLYAQGEQRSSFNANDAAPKGFESSVGVDLHPLMPSSMSEKKLDPRKSDDDDEYETIRVRPRYWPSDDLKEMKELFKGLEELHRLKREFLSDGGQTPVNEAPKDGNPSSRTRKARS